MFAFLVRRVLLLSAVVAGISFGAFAAVYYGNNYEWYAIGCQPGHHFEQCHPEDYAVLREVYGFDRPIVVQFADYVCGGVCVPDARHDGVVRGDFGRALREFGHYPDYARTSLLISAQLGLAALIVLYGIGLPLGVLAAAKRGTWIDTWIVVASTAVKSAPVFVLVPVLWIVAALRLEIMDQPSRWDGPFSVNSILPVAAASPRAPPLVVLTTRAGIIGALSQDYVRAARAKGLPERMVVSRHVLRTALTPLVSGLVPTLAALLSGLLLVEVLFGILGFANVFIRSLTHGDGQTILAGVVVGIAAWAVCSLAADLLHMALDPRLRFGGPRLWSRPAREAFAA